MEGFDAAQQREPDKWKSRPGVGERELTGFRRDELQDLLDGKAAAVGLSFSVVDHLRWDMKQIFDMAVAEGHIQRNPALLLFSPETPRSRCAGS